MVKEAMDGSSPLQSPATIPSERGRGAQVQYELRVEADWPLAAASNQVSTRPMIREYGVTFDVPRSCISAFAPRAMVACSHVPGL